jgi:hypothetical protein
LIQKLKIILIQNKSENPEKADNDFKSKKGKVILGRLIEGGNPNEITNALKRTWENYDKKPKGRKCRGYFILLTR